MEKIIWADRVKNEEILQRVQEERNILQTIKRREANWIGHILSRNCLVKHVLEGEVKVASRQGRRSKLLLCDIKEKYIGIGKRTQYIQAS
jgi:hypothetical protein